MKLTTSPKRALRRKESGLAAIEFLIVVPTLMMLAALLIDVGRAFIQYTEITKALQNGARYAVVDTYGTLDFGAIAEEANIKNVVLYGTPTIGDGATPLFDYITVDDIVVTQPTNATKEVTLSTSYTYEPIFATLPFTETSLAFTVGASTKMRTEP